MALLYNLDMQHVKGRVYEITATMGGITVTGKVAEADEYKRWAYAHGPMIANLIANNWELEGETPEHPERETYCPTPPAPAPAPEPEPEPIPDEPTPEGGDEDVVIP